MRLQLLGNNAASNIKSAKYGLDPDLVPDSNFSKVLSGIIISGSTTIL
jgi:hypothetical protein